MTREEAVRRIERAAEEKLTQLDLSGLDLEELSPEIGKCMQLETLVFRGCNQKKGERRKNHRNKFPDAVLQLTNLKILTLTQWQITEIPEELGQLSNLTVLDLGDNQITQIPETFGSLSHLTQLYLNHNQITQIPETIGQPSNLTHLDLSHNQIPSIPEALGQLSNLTMANFYNNSITQIPEAIELLSFGTQWSDGEDFIQQIPPQPLEYQSNLRRGDFLHPQIMESPEGISEPSEEEE